MKRLCVFDLDGTLVDSIYDIADAVNRALKKLGRTQHPTEAYYRMVGDGMDMLCRRALGTAEEAEVQELIRLYQADYLQNCCRKTLCYPEIGAVLEELKNAGIQLAIVSNKPQEQTETVVSGLFEKGLFVRVIGSRSGVPKKPNPQVLVSCMKECSVFPDEVWYIGDSDVDMQFGHAAGVETIGAAWGFRGSEELRAAGATEIAETPRAMLHIIKKER